MITPTVMKTHCVVGRCTDKSPSSSKRKLCETSDWGRFYWRWKRWMKLNFLRWTLHFFSVMGRGGGGHFHCATKCAMRILLHFICGVTSLLQLKRMHSTYSLRMRLWQKNTLITFKKVGTNTVADTQCKRPFTVGFGITIELGLLNGMV